MLHTLSMRYSGVILQFLVLASLAQKLDEQSYGMYMLVLSISLPVYFLIGLGTSEFCVREVPKLDPRKHQRQRSDTVGATLFITFSTSIIVIGTAGIFLLASNASPDTVAFVLFTSVFTALNGTTFNCSQVLLSLGREKSGSFYFYPALNVALLVVTVPVVFLHSAPDFSIVALSSSVAASIMALCAVVAVVRTERPTWPPRTLVRRSISVGFPLTLARALYSIGLWIPTLSAGFTLSIQEAGLLGTAGRLTAAVAAVTAATRFVVRPAIVQARLNGDMKSIRVLCRRASNLGLLAAAAAFIGLFLVGRPLVSTFFGDSMVPVIPMVFILLLGVSIEALGGPVDEVLKMTGHHKDVLTVLGFSTITLLLVQLLIARLGVQAILYTQVVYMTFVTSSLLILVRRRLGIWILPFLSTIRPTGGQN